MVKSKIRFFRCKLCGNIVTYLEEGGGTLVCCGETMEELVPNTSDGAFEKHVPKLSVNGQSVDVIVGETEHPMSEEHYIQWIGLLTKKGFSVKWLCPQSVPKATFEICEDDMPVAVYAYCNLHGLWKKDF